MGSWTSRYLLYMAAAGELGYAEKVSGNFAKIEEALGTNEDVLDAHKASHDTVNGKLKLSADILVPEPHIIEGKVKCNYVLTPVHPLVTATTLTIGLEQSLQVYQVGPGETLSGSIPLKGAASQNSTSVRFVDAEMNTLSSSTLASTMTEYLIPEGTSGIYCAKGGAYTGSKIEIGKFTIS